ncbi:MAG: PKD domain-containing protein [Vicinamibacterales bacterium]
MRTFLLAVPVVLSAVLFGCKAKNPVGPGTVIITETTTSTSTTTTTTSTVAVPTVASFVFSPLTPEVLQLVNFNAAGSTAGSNRRIVSYSWDFGDGVTKTGVTATHDFFPSGVYLVTLTVTDDQGKDTQFAQTITVRPVVP